MIQYKYITDEVLEQKYKMNGAVINGKVHSFRTGSGVPEPGGIFDYKIFGRYLKCGCSKKYKGNSGICPICGVEVFHNKKEMRKKKALYEMPFCYLTKSAFLNKIDNPYNIGTLRVWTQYLDKTKKGEDVYITINGINYSWYPASIETKLDDLGLNGLYKLLRNSDEHKDLLKGLSKYIVISNPVDRDYKKSYCSGKYEYPKETSQYAYLIRTCEVIITHWDNFDLEDRAAAIVGVNLMMADVEAGNDLLSGDLKAKEGLIRTITQKRVPRSGQSVIIGNNTLKVNEIIIPKALIKYALQHDLIKRMTEDPEYNIDYYEACLQYIKEGDIFQQVYKLYTENLHCMFIRNPGLYKLNIQGMKVISDDREEAVAIQIPNLTQRSYNADIDGDKMQFILMPFTQGEEMFKLMNIARDWKKDKNGKYLFDFDESYLSGLYFATKMENEEPIKFNSLEEVQKAYSNQLIWANTPIELENNLTTYGREVISSILGKPLKYVLKGEEVINGKNLDTLMEYLEGQILGLNMIQQLQEFAAEVATYEGISSLTVEDYVNLEKGVEKIADYISSLNTGIDSHRELNKQMRNHLELKSREISNLQALLDSNSGISFQSIMNMVYPKIKYHNDQLQVFSDSTLINGMDIEHFIEASIQGRQFNIAKQAGVPISGWITQQLTLALNDYIYYDEDMPTNNYIELEEKYLVGRTRLDGSIVKPNQSNNIIKVQSVVGSKTHKVYRNMVHKDYPNENYIGINFGSAFSEGITQSALSLKHSKNKGLDIWKYIVCQKEGKIDEISDNFVIIGGLKYLISHKVKLIERQFYKKGDIIAILNEGQGLSYVLDCLITVLGTQKADVKSKTYPKPVMNRTIYGGKIKYDTKEKLIKIGEQESYELSENEIYLFPEGYELKPNQSFCSGCLNLREYIKMYGTVAFSVFYAEMCELTGPTIPEIIEPMFNTLLTHKTIEHKLKNGNAITKIAAIKDKETPFFKEIYQNLNESTPLDLYAKFTLGLDLNESMYNTIEDEE